jgi:3-hydroxybutyryl-CoA dehydratase
MIDLVEGQEKRIQVHISAADVTSFIALSGDAAPLHIDRDFAQKARYTGPVVHGALLIAYVSRLVGMEIPGQFSIMERIDMAFRHPCYAPCDLQIVGKVRQISEAVSSVVLDISVQDPTGRAVATGKTWHRILDRSEFS